MFSIDRLLVLIPAFPLAATLIVAIFGKRVLKENSHLPVVIGIALSFFCSVMLLANVHSAAEGEHPDSVGWEHTVNLWTWLDVPDVMATPPDARMDASAAVSSQLAPPKTLPFNIAVTLRADPLSAIMLVMVTFISSLVAIYASGYMHGDPGYWRFFTYIALFVFSMTMLVSVSNFVLLYVFWEAVGACSYLLIGFWFEKPAAAAAGKKAFLVNRVGDFGFALGLFLLWTTYGTLNFHDADGIAGILGQTRLAHPNLYVGGPIDTPENQLLGMSICLLLLLGACGKSAQFPLHVWLPDAMEGPTPVSALIHAATMVTAGVYMVTRCTPLFFVSEEAQHVVAIIGGITLTLGGVIAVTQNDLKRVLAYSTVSQLGYMFLGLGVGTLSGITSGMFHLFTHAFFKALLFLGAGSVMHAMGGVIDMRHFGGLRRLMPITCWTFLCGCLALAGVFPFAGFWSKDAIVAAVHDRAEHAPLYEYLYYAALITAFLTAMYTFRAFFLTFFGPEKAPHEAGHHAHESPAPMTVPLMILGFCAVTVGAAFALPEMWGGHNGFVELLKQTPSLAFASIQPEHEPHFHGNIAMISTLVAVAGVGLAAFLYLGDRSQADWLASRLRVLYVLSYNKLFIDEIYRALFVWPLWLLAQLSYAVDRYVIDGLVNLVGKVPALVGSSLRALQNGMVQFYALAMVLGVLVLIGTLLLWTP